MRRNPSLKARAVAYLSRREHSRRELQRKLTPYADDPAELESVLDDLARDHWQSDQRYARAYVDHKAPRQGALRILQALRQQGLTDADLEPLQRELQASELTRARAVWRHRFGQAAADARAYAHQYRYLAGRGFSGDCIRQVLRDGGSPDPDDV